MFGQQGNLFPSFQTAAAEPVFQILPDVVNDHDSVYGELGLSSSYGDSPSSKSSSNTTYGAQSPSFIQRSISCHSLISSYNLESENSHASYQHCRDKWSSCQVASEGIYESMNRATPYNAEEKKERIERYKSKRSLRNFNKKIKYECRKTLADSRPRVRGRFARNDEIEKVNQPQWDCQFVDEDEYSWINLLDAVNKSDALISSF